VNARPWPLVFFRPRCVEAVSTAWIVLVLTALLGALMGKAACMLPSADPAPAKAACIEGKRQEDEETLRWFFILGAINTYPGLQRELLIKQYFDPVVQCIAPGYPGTATFTDMRDDYLLWPPQIAIGRTLSDYWALSVHAGYSEGTVRTKTSDPSIFLGIPLFVDFKVKRMAWYVGLDLDCFPLGAVELRDYHGLRERLRAAKPTLGARVTLTGAGFEAGVRLGFGLVRSLGKIEFEDDWVLPSVNLNAGVDIPWSKRSVLVFNAGYNFFEDQKKDFNGTAYTVGWRYFFK